MTTSQNAWWDRLDHPDVVLGGHINAMRFLKKCSQADLGEAIGVSQSVMSKKLRGEVGITFTELVALARYFDLSLEDMIPAKMAGERRLGVRRASEDLYASRDLNPEPADSEVRHLRAVPAGVNRGLTVNRILCGEPVPVPSKPREPCRPASSRHLSAVS